MHLPELTLRSGRIIGKLKPLNGGNLAPPLCQTNLTDISKPFMELKIPYTRLHDAPLENPAWRIVDFNLIFPFMHLDSDEPKNYYFEQTDEYISHCLELGTRVIYRLGPSIEHHPKRYNTRAVPRELWDKWADVAAHIVLHYNEGWGKGFRFGIRYWEIWNEPEGLWDGSIDDFNDFYCHVATVLKRRFPELMIGGPAHVRCDRDGFTGGFLRRCAERKAPLDFYSWHCYTDNVEFMREQVFYARETVDAFGYPKAELHLNEWHYVPGTWSGVKPEKKNFMYDYKMKDLDAGAFLTATMTAWQDTPLDIACYYTATATAFGLFTTSRGIPTKSYYAMKAFGRLMEYPERLEVLSNDRDLYALAGRNSAGGIALLISVFHVRGNAVRLRIEGGAVPLEQFNVSENCDLEPAAFRAEDECFLLTTDSKPAVILLLLGEK